MKKLFILFVALICFLEAKTITPSFELEAHGNVLDLVVFEKRLYVSTDNSMIDVFDIESGKLIQTIAIEKIKDFMGDIIGAKIYSVDVSSDAKAIMLLAEGENGSREIYLYKDEKLTKIIDHTHKLFMKKAKFWDDTHLLIATMGNELMLYDITQKSFQYKIQLNQSSFSDFALSQDKRLVASTCESGEIFIVDVASSKVQKILKGANLDNLYKVDFVSKYVSGAGQDRKGSLYKLSTGDFVTFDASFLIYATALSPKEKYVAYAFNEDNDIAIFQISTRSKKFVLKGQKSTLNAIKFVDEKRVISGSDDRFIMVWDLQ